MSVEVGAFGEVLTEETVGVLVGSTLPSRMGIAEVDVEVGICAELAAAGGAPPPDPAPPPAA